QTTGSAPKEDRNQISLKGPQPEAAPGADTEKAAAAEGTAQKKKKKKKKQNPSANEKKTQETEINRKAKAEANGCQQKDTSHQNEASQSEDQLWKEVTWCVEQLELGLKTQKPTAKQAEEALRAIRTLRNDKAPLVKKRQLMRTMFGDYRKKMEEERSRELKLMEMAVKSARVVKVKRSVCDKSCRFIRKSRKSQGSTGSPSGSASQPSRGLLQFTAPQEEFRFNFL
ncbi:CH033 protein, partial [Rhinopomastus cyanomelas]|nr:CH033 protein [Rhinopomastus cyanomelas]